MDLDNLSELKKIKKNLFDKIMALPSYEEFAGNTLDVENLDKEIDKNNEDYNNITSTKYQAKIKQDIKDSRAKLEAQMVELEKANKTITQINDAETEAELDAISVEGKHADRIKQAIVERRNKLKEATEKVNEEQGNKQADTTEETTTTTEAETTKSTEAVEEIIGNFNIGESVPLSPISYLATSIGFETSLTSKRDIFTP